MGTELPPFDPEWLAAEQMMGGRMTLPPEPVDQARGRFDAVFKGIEPFLPPPDDSVQTTDVIVPSSKQRVRVYKPTNAGSALSVGLYIHSGGWYSGSIENEDFICRNVAAQSQIILFSAEYRLSPEHPYPAAFEDVCAAYEFMIANASTHGGDSTRKFVMGGSAGGNLTAAVGLKYAQDTHSKPSGLFIFVPATCDPSALPSEYRTRYTPEMYADAPMIGNALVTQAREWYNAPATEPFSSVLLHPDIKSLPPCYIAACNKDPLHQETLFFYEECKKQGVSAELAKWKGMPHFFWAVPMLNKSQEFMQLWNEKLKAMIADTGK